MISFHQIPLTWWNAYRRLIACKSDPAELPKSWLHHWKICEVVSLILDVFLAYLVNLKAFKVAADINQAAANINLGLKAITDMKKFSKATADVKPLKSTLTRSLGRPNFRTIKMVKLVANFQWCHRPKINFRVAPPGQIYRLLLYQELILVEMSCSYLKTAFKHSSA